MSNVRLISITKPEITLNDKHLTPEDLIVYCARVSSPKNQENTGTGQKLLEYCISNKHWSIFEMVNMCVEIITSRAISAQILRHKSFSFQEASQRYSEVQNFEIYEARRQDLKNRQNSVDNLSVETKEWFDKAQNDIIIKSNELYSEALNKGIAKECARFLLPLNTKTKLYMNGSIRSWIHYLDLRTSNGTQLEHKDIAEEIKEIFIINFPLISKGLKWETR